MSLLRPTLSFAFPILLAVPLGCGGSASDDQADGSQTGDGDGDVPAGGNGSGGIGSGGTATGGAATGGVGAGGTPTTPTEVLPSDLYPMAVGNSWTYLVEEKVAGSCPADTRTAAFTEEAFAGGRDAFIGGNVCNPDVFTTLSVNEGRIEQYYELEERWFVSFQSPLVDGATWDPLDGITFVWEEVGSYSVPAGNFDDCWHRISVGQGSQNTYCAFVGLVRLENDEFVAELSSYVLAP